MRKDEFLDELEGLLSCLPAAQVDEACRFYAEAVDDRMEDGMSEEEAVAALGTSKDAAEAILNDLPAVPRAIAKTRRRSNALLWTLAILGSPIWVPLLLGFAAVALGIYACIWTVALCIWASALAFGIVGVAEGALMVAGINAGLVPYTIASLGCAIAFIGAAFLVGVGAWAATKQLARLSALWARKALSPFVKKGKASCKAEADAPVSSDRRGKKSSAILVAASALIAAGVLLAFAGFAAAGFDASVFSAQVDGQTGVVVLGGTRISDSFVYQVLKASSMTS